MRTEKIKMFVYIIFVHKVERTREDLLNIEIFFNEKEKKIKRQKKNFKLLDKRCLKKLQ